MSAVEASDYLSADAQSSCAPEPQAQLAAKRRALRRRAAAERLRREEASNCDKVLTYLVEQYRWIDKLVRRATSPNFDGAHGYISLILNTLRLAVQVDRRRPTGAAEPGKPAARPTAARPAGKRHTKAEQPASPAGGGRGDCAAKGPDEPHSEASDSEAMLPDLAYHDPATRERLSEYPLYRLQRWEISLLYSPAFRAHLPALRQQALLMARKIVEFKLCDSAHRVISSESDGTGQRPVPYFSPQKVQPPLVLDNTDLKKKRLQINVELLLGDRCAAALSPSSSRAPPASASASSSLAAALAHGAPAKGKAGAELPAPQPVDEVGININSLFARMLGFTEDLVGLPHVPAAAGDSGAAKSDKAAAVAEPLPGDGADVVTDEEGGARGHDGDRDTKTRKSGASGYSKTGSSRWKKSKPALGTPASGLFEDVGPETASEAAEAICSALVSEGGGGSRHAPSSRTRKKPATASGTVRRRRARLQRRLSASSLTDAASGQPSPDAAAPAAHASDAPSLPARDASAPAGLAHSMQSLDLEQ
ncbi:hypothetical protein LPJ61_004698 [Coemansia biformis]|uniref:Uncharacterized protein n=1 Tax=Coemansia biformis TaxID=1286918 RepID=A0A9W7YA65_9FUNG|nr:hypothetical protein LPJ61_004698 [Coemansia biformis]